MLIKILCITDCSSLAISTQLKPLKFHRNEVSYKGSDITDSEIFPKVSFHIDYGNPLKNNFNFNFRSKILSVINCRTETTSFIFIVLLLKKARHKYLFYLGMDTIQQIRNAKNSTFSTPSTYMQHLVQNV